MAKDNSAPASGGNNVSSVSCCFEKCVNKGYKMNFCSEHFGWFKEGLVDRKGVKPSDFDKKYQAYMMRKKAA